MNLIHDTIKIHMVDQGFLPNYPYHLISDNEMCDGFLNYPNDNSMTDDEKWDTYKNKLIPDWMSYYYPMPVNSYEYIYQDPTKEIYITIEEAYRALIENLVYYLTEFKQSTADNKMLPSWIYPYMMGSVLGTKSNSDDIHSFLVSLNIDNLADEFTLQANRECYRISKAWLGRLPYTELDHRVPTLFGAPHVLKYIATSEA